jgi:hypothetical protein
MNTTDSKNISSALSSRLEPGSRGGENDVVDGRFTISEMGPFRGWPADFFKRAHFATATTGREWRGTRGLLLSE